MPAFVYRRGDALLLVAIAVAQVVLPGQLTGHWLSTASIAFIVFLCALCSINDIPLRSSNADTERTRVLQRLRDRWVPSTLGPRGLILRLALPLPLLALGIPLALAPGHGWAEALLVAAAAVAWIGPLLLTMIWLLDEVILKDARLTAGPIALSIVGPLLAGLYAVVSGDDLVLAWAIGGPILALLLGVVLTDAARQLRAQLMEDAQASLAVRPLAAPPPVRVVKLRGELKAFLRCRGVTEPSLELAEGLLREGDRVEVSGAVERVLRAEGYRGTAEVEALVGRAGAPLHLRVIEDKAEVTLTPPPRSGAAAAPR